jgi:hypothetical protein
MALARPGFPRFSVSHFVFNGRIVAYLASTFGVDSGCTSIAVVDVALRRRLLSVPGVSCSVDAGIISGGEITDFLVTPVGSVAWIIHEHHLRESDIRVMTARLSSGTTLLDEGPAIVPGSLRLDHGVLSWEDGGVKRSFGLA